MSINRGAEPQPLCPGQNLLRFFQRRPSTCARSAYDVLPPLFPSTGPAWLELEDLQLELDVLLLRLELELVDRPRDFFPRFFFLLFLASFFLSFLPFFLFLSLL